MGHPAAGANFGGTARAELRLGRVASVEASVGRSSHPPSRGRRGRSIGSERAVAATLRPVCQSSSCRKTARREISRTELLRRQRLRDPLLAAATQAVDARCRLGRGHRSQAWPARLDAPVILTLRRHTSSDPLPHPLGLLARTLPPSEASAGQLRPRPARLREPRPPLSWRRRGRTRRPRGQAQPQPRPT